jgi:penicillin-binding protein 1A
VYRHSAESTSISAADAASFYQLKTMLQGVVEQGTASRMKHLAPYVAGKTGTSDDENDVWFVGFTNDVTIAVWVGYDNAHGKRRTLGAGHTGGSVAVPIFEEIAQASWADGLRQEPLNGPSPAARQLLAVTTQDRNGDRRTRLVEYLRLDPNGRAPESRRATVRGVPDTAKSRPARQYVRRDPWEWGSAARAYSWGWGGPTWTSQSRRRSFEPAPSSFWR